KTRLSPRGSTASPIGGDVAACAQEAGGRPPVSNPLHPRPASSPHLCRKLPDPGRLWFSTRASGPRSESHRQSVRFASSHRQHGLKTRVTLVCSLAFNKGSEMSRSNRILFAFLTCGILAVCAALARADDWKPAKGPLVTRWAKDVSPTNAHPEYPRPQMVRSEWQSLNGLWQFAAAREGEQPPVGKDLKEQILVPFPVESSLSGVMRHEERMWYRRTFQVPSDWRSRHVLLHLDAVDWEAVVYLNGQKLGTHRGGYDAFGYDVTKHLKPDGPQELIVGVYDPTNQWDQPRGKQVTRPRGIFYTPTSGIWQTVWIEPVPEQFIESMQIVPEVDAGEVKITVTPLGAVRKLPVSATVSLKEEGSGASSSFSGSASGFTGRPLTINIPNASLWSPEHPVLYSLHLTLSPDNKPGDQIDGYFAMRKISVGKDDKGINRLMLNNKPIFMVGPLDQGFWPDGIYTAPTDDAL